MALWFRLLARQTRIKKCGSNSVTIGIVFRPKNDRIRPFHNNGGNSFKIHLGPITIRAANLNVRQVR